MTCGLCSCAVAIIARTLNNEMSDCCRLDKNGRIIGTEYIDRANWNLKQDYAFCTAQVLH